MVQREEGLTATVALVLCHVNTIDYAFENFSGRPLCQLQMGLSYVVSNQLHAHTYNYVRTERE